jgi:branched-chain amino acid aminotransferase
MEVTMKITITKTNNPSTLPEEGKLGFGKYFSDHMFIMDYDVNEGWHDARIVPFQNI